MSELLTTKNLIIGLLKIGGAPNVEELFKLIVNEAPKLVGAVECSIFWKNGLWRIPYRKEGTNDIPDGFYRRATYDKKIKMIGVDFYKPGEGLTGWVIKHGKSLRIDDITDENSLKNISEDLVWLDKGRGYKKAEEAKEAEKQRAFLAVPIIIDDEVLGVIRIAKTIEPRGKFNEEHKELLETFAEHIGAIIQNTEKNRLEEWWSKLYQSGIDYGKAEFDEYLNDIVVNQVLKFLDAQACSLFLTEDVGGRLILRLSATTSGGPLQDEVGKATYEFGEGITGWVAKNNKSLRIKDVENKEELANIADDLIHKGKHEEYIKRHSSFLAAPIQIGGSVLGVLRIAKDSEGHFFSPLDQRLTEYFCMNLAVLIQNVQLYERVEFDKNRAVTRLSETKRKLAELSGPIIKDITEIRNSLRGLFPDERSIYCFKFGKNCSKELKQDKNTVFIGIPFTSYYQNLYDFGIEPALNDIGLSPWIASEQKGIIDIMCKICEGIQSSYLGIIDISEWNPNVLFELGLLYGQGHPVLLIVQNGSKIPIDLAGMEYIKYDKFKELRETLKDHIKSMISII